MSVTSAGFENVLNVCRYMQKSTICSLSKTKNWSEIKINILNEKLFLDFILRLISRLTSRKYNDFIIWIGQFFPMFSFLFIISNGFNDWKWLQDESLNILVITWLFCHYCSENSDEDQNKDRKFGKWINRVLNDIPKLTAGIGVFSKKSGA